MVNKMNCEKTELYMNTLLDNELPVKDSLEVISHMENCKLCKEKWELNEETRSRLKHYISLIKASPKFRQRISSKITSNPRVRYIKSILLAASITFLLGLGLFIESPFEKAISLDTLYNNSKIQLASTDISKLSQHIGVPLNDSQLSAFKEAQFNIEGATKLQKPFKKDISLISFKNSAGEKVSLCFLPDNYKISMCHEIEMNGVTFHCGQSKDCQFAYWKQDGKTIALVSKDFVAEEMIYLAVPMIKQA